MFSLSLLVLVLWEVVVVVLGADAWRVCVWVALGLGWILVRVLFTMTESRLDRQAGRQSVRQGKCSQACIAITSRPSLFPGPPQAH